MEAASIVFVGDAAGTAAYVLRVGRHPRLRWSGSTAPPARARSSRAVCSTCTTRRAGRSTSTRRQPGGCSARYAAAPGHWSSPIVIGGRIILPTGGSAANNASAQPASSSTTCPGSSWTAAAAAGSARARVRGGPRGDGDRRLCVVDAAAQQRGAAATRHATIENANVSCSPERNGAEISWGRTSVRPTAPGCARQSLPCVSAEQVLRSGCSRGRRRTGRRWGEPRGS